MILTTLIMLATPASHCEPGFSLHLSLPPFLLPPFFLLSLLPSSLLPSLPCPFPPSLPLHSFPPFFLPSSLTFSLILLFLPLFLSPSVTGPLHLFLILFFHLLVLFLSLSLPLLPLSPFYSSLFHTHTHTHSTQHHTISHISTHLVTGTCQKTHLIHISEWVAIGEQKRKGVMIAIK